MKTSGIVALFLVGSAHAVTYNISAGEDFEAECFMKVQPGDTCYLAPGNYYHDGLTIVHGTQDAPITITGHPKAVIRGSNTQDRIIQIAHDYYILSGFTINAKHGDEYASTAIYILGADKKKKINIDGVEVMSSVTGVVIKDMTIMNCAGECVHYRYFVTNTLFTNNNVMNCGIHAFQENRGGKVGEGIYLGTALSQVGDSKAPEVKLRTGRADNVEADECTYNVIHSNTFTTRGNECVDVKEGSHHNYIYNNICNSQMDENSGGFGLRGSENTVCNNTIVNCEGAGVRIGGIKGFGIKNNVYGNVIRNCRRGAFTLQSFPQELMCENAISNVPTVTYGTYRKSFSYSSLTGTCGVVVSPRIALDDKEPNTEVVEMNSVDLEAGDSECGSSLQVSRIIIGHSDFQNNELEAENMIDGDTETYFSVKKPFTSFIFELESTQFVDGVTIGFFKKKPSEDRIQMFDISTSVDGDEWNVPIAERESTVIFQDTETFKFFGREAKYVKFTSGGNRFNEWTALTEFRVCTSVETLSLFEEDADAVENNAHDLGSTFEFCSAKPLDPKLTETHGGIGKAHSLADGNFVTRWSTNNTIHEDIDNDKVAVTLEGDTHVKELHIAFFNGEVSIQYMSVYVQSANDKEWHVVEELENVAAAKTDALQIFTFDEPEVTTLYIVPKGNDQGHWSKISEIKIYGCL